MLNNHSPIEAHFTTHRAPKGGVAPLRHELALHDYLEQQQARLDSAAGRPAVTAGIIATIVRLAKSLVRRGVTQRSGRFGLQR